MLTLRLEQGGAAVPADNAHDSRASVSLSLTHREEIKGSKSWLTVAGSSYRRGQGAQRAVRHCSRVGSIIGEFDKD